MIVIRNPSFFNKIGAGFSMDFHCMVIWIFPDAAHQKVLFYPEIFHSLYAVESQKKDRYFSQIQQQPTNSTRSWISSAWQNGALSEHRMVLLSPDVPPSCRQMRPSRQYLQQYWPILANINTGSNPQIQIRGMLGFAVCPPGICRF